MTTSSHVFSWRFGGWLSGQTPEIAWSLLGAGALLSVGFTLWSYRHALAEVPFFCRVVLGSLRAALCLTLLLILAAPTRIEQTYETSAARPLAVLVDRSGSMTTPDNRQRRRLDDALQRWRALEPTARQASGAFKSFAFADGFARIASPDSTTELPDGQTALFTSLQRVLAEAPAGGWGGIVTLTDGLDTSTIGTAEGVESTTRAALTTSTPLFFLAGHNRFSGGAFFNLREFATPNQTAPRSTIHIEATFDCYQASESTLPVEFKVNGVARPPETLKLQAGRHLVNWSADVQADKLGDLDLELKAGQEIARTTVRVALPPSNRILYFQGALDWGYRFLADILKRDAAFTLTPVFNFPNPNVLLPPGALKKMPTTRAELAGFDIVVLANAAANQFSAAQQSALSDWVHDGGILLFLTPDDDSTQGFAGSELEKMLPVVFLPPSPEGSYNVVAGALSRLRNHGQFGASFDRLSLTSYAWEDSPRVHEIFADTAKFNAKTSTPVFSSYAHVARAKPGAEVLARHPTEIVSETNEHAILLALQRYGRGQSVVLTTDALWRWKLNQPSTERSAELFWQNLLAWLSRDRSHGLRFDRPPFHAQVDRDLVFRVADAEGEKLTLKATLGTEQVTLNEGATEDAKRVFHWEPNRPGFWTITATDGNGHTLRHWVTADQAPATGELSGEAPNEDLLRVLATRTGGAVLDKEPPPAWRETPAPAELLAERQEPLWHRSWIFGLLLFLYCAELFLRRSAHLL